MSDKDKDLGHSETDTDFGRELIASMKEGVAIAKGEAEPARVHWPDVRALRTRMGLTREAFAKRFGLELAAVRDWEQGLRRPSGPARVLLRVIDREPEAVVRALDAA